MKFLDVTLPIWPGMTVWPGDPSVEVEEVQEIADEGFHVSRLSMGTHTGTHVDPPRHLFRDAPGVDALPLEVLMGPCYVADLRGVREVRPADLEAAGVPAGVTRLLLLTDNSEWIGTGGFKTDFVALTPGAAAWLLDRGVRLVGIDALSIETFDGDGTVHRKLLEAGVIIVEGLDLRDVTPGEYEMVCLPMKIAGGDGAPARVVLLDSGS